MPAKTKEAQLFHARNVIQRVVEKKQLRLAGTSKLVIPNPHEARASEFKAFPTPRNDSQIVCSSNCWQNIPLS
jgi:hypothetical protein